MKQILTLLFIGLCAISSTAQIAHTQYPSESTLLSWFYEHSFLIVDESEDGLLSLHELQSFYAEFQYFLTDNRFFYTDLDKDGKLSWEEIYPHFQDAWNFRLEAENLEISKLAQSYPYFSSLQAQYLKRHPTLAQTLLSNYSWMIQHITVARKLIKNENWLRQHPLAALSIHTNLRWLIDHPDLATLFYRHKIFNSFPSNFTQWRWDHLSYVNKNPSHRVVSVSNELIRPIAPNTTPRSIKTSNLYPLSTPSNWRQRLDSIDIVNQSLMSKYIQDKELINRLTVENNTLKDKFDRLNRTNNSFQTQIIQERDSLILLSRRQLMELNSLKTSFTQSDQQRKHLQLQISTKVDSLNFYYTELAKEKEEQDLRIENLLRENTALKSRPMPSTSSSSPTISSLKRRVSQQTAEIHRLRDEAYKQRELYNRSLTRYKDSLNLLKKKGTFNLPTPAEIAVMREGMHALKIRLASLEQQSKTNTERYQDSISYLHHQWNIQVQQYTSHIDQLENELTLLQAQSTSQLASSAHAYGTTEDWDKLQRQLETLALENGSMKEQLEANANFVTSTLIEKQRLEERINNLQSKNQELKASNRDLLKGIVPGTVNIEDSVNNYLKKISKLEQLLNNQGNAYNIEKELAARRATSLEETIKEQKLQIENLEKERKISRERIIAVANKERTLEKEGAKVQQQAQLLKQIEAILAEREKKVIEEEKKLSDLQQLENSLKLREQKIKQQEQQQKSN